MNKKLVLIRDDFKLGGTIIKQFIRSGFRPSYLRGLLGGQEGAVSPFETDCYAIKIYEKGKKNKNRVIGLISLPSDWIPTAGFFALLHRTMNGIAFCDRMGFVPVIDTWKDCPYQDNDVNDKQDNVYEYFFNQPCISLYDALQSYNVMIPSNANMDLIFFENDCEWFIPSDSYIDRMAAIWNKYIHFRKDVFDNINDSAKHLLDGKKTLGIHFRGTDRVVNANGHPISLTVEDYIDLVNFIKEKNKYEQVFLATDDINALNTFKEKVDGVVYHEDILRTDGKVAIHFLKSEREHNGFLCGMEILKDTLTLSMCQGFIAGISQVSIFARIMNKASGNDYEYIKIISKGMNHNDKEWMDIFDDWNN